MSETIGQAIQRVAGLFEQAELCHGHGADNPLDEAAWLVLAALRLPPEVPPAVYETVLTGQEQEAIARLAARRIDERVPTAYLTGYAWFCGLRFHVDSSVLIPRSPIAELIEAGFSPWIAPERTVDRVLDIGTGSACIAIACARMFPEADVDAVDVSEAALALARSNIDAYGLTGRVRAIRSDLFEALEGRRYDLIVSNPPYVDEKEMAALPEEFRREPALGLAGGRDGLDIVTRILREAPGYLAPDGVLVVEVGTSQDALVRRYPRVPFLWLEFEYGGQGVFLLTAGELAAAASYLHAGGD
jgi:ribosomal protein L3 glutamine methyltransferase